MTHPANKRAHDCAQLMLEARDRAQLDELKARFGETTTRQAWNTLTPLEQARVKAAADTTQLTIADAPAAPSPKRTLFRLGEELAQLDARIDEFEGELEEGSEPLQEIDRFIQTKTETLGEFSQKVDDYCSLIAMRKASAAAREAEAKRMQELAERDHRLADRLSETLKAVLAARGGKIRTVRFNVTVANNGGVLPLEIDEDVDLKQLPAQFVRRVETYEFNREAIRAALDVEEDVGFCRYGQRGTHLRIK